MKKKTILMLSDHPLSTSGVGTQARWLITGLINTGKYSFRCFGGAVKHDDYNLNVVNSDFIVKPTDGFGDRNLLRQTLVQLQPDALMLFTDPRFFIWVWEMEDEIRKICPITYWHLWDNDPWPDFNRVLYESTDLINCINWPTYQMVKERFPEKTNYIPHAVPKELYKPLPQEEVVKFKKKLLGEDRLDHFIVGYVSRNARRKMPSDIIASWKMFLDELERKHGHRKATLVMHTEPLDPEGPNLYHVIETVGVVENVIFSKSRVGFEEMSLLYNSFDTIVNRSCNEGFGLPTLESMMCGKPIIALKTGGLTRQVQNHETGEQYGVGLDPDVRCLTGNQLVPYIYEDLVSHKTLSDAYMKMYEMGPEERKELGLKAMKHAHEDYNIDNVIKDWDDSLTKIIDKWKERPRTWSHTEI
ncbi:MAG: glycosyltransferase [Chlamydiae bacterium]|nr:glycosyltransferase [Chlamydiota bacterium]